MIKSIKPLTYEKDGLEIIHAPYLNTDEFLKIQRKTFSDLTPGRNSSNQINRGIRWGIFQNDDITLNSRSTYSLPKELNKEEEGRVRDFDLIDETFIERPEIQQLIRDVFYRMNFLESSYTRAYEITIAALGYRVSNSVSAIPSPIYPHQDLLDGLVIVMNQKNVIGGTSRIYSLDETPLYEFELEPGVGYLFKDSEILHQVTPVIYQANKWPELNYGFRDVLIIRFQPVGR